MDCKNQIWKTTNLLEGEKAEAVQQHLHLATEERKHYYKECCHETKDCIQDYLQEAEFLVGQRPCSYSETVHYSCNNFTIHPIHTNRQGGDFQKEAPTILDVAHALYQSHP